MNTHAFFASAARNVSRAGASAILSMAVFSALFAIPKPAFAQAPIAPAVQAAPIEGDGPALWVVRDEDSTLYLFGSVHVLRPTTAWETPRIKAAFEASSDVWMEISNPDDQAAIVPLIQQHGLSPQTPLSSLLTAEEFADLDAAAKTLGATGAQLDPMRPWLAGLTLSVAPLTKAGYDPKSGVELILKSRAEAAGKPIHGFETIDEQVRILAGLPEADQVDFLRAMLEDFDEAVTLLDGMVTAWSGGDVDELDRIVVKEMKTDAPAAYDALLVRRNANWAGQIETLLKGSGTAFIVVGAAHLAGADSVQSMLEARGVDVRPAA